MGQPIEICGHRLGNRQRPGRRFRRVCLGAKLSRLALRLKEIKRGSTVRGRMVVRRADRFDDILLIAKISPGNPFAAR